MTIQQARIAVAQQIGGIPSGYDGSMFATNQLPDEKKQALTAALVNYIANNPGQFTTAQVATANAELGRAQTLTGTGGYDNVTFWGEVGNNLERAGSAVANIGEGVITTVGVGGKLIPYAALLFVLVLVFPYIKASLNKKV